MDLDLDHFGLGFIVSFLIISVSEQSSKNSPVIDLEGFERCFSFLIMFQFFVNP